jgi:hypothetical protein
VSGSARAASRSPRRRSVSAAAITRSRSDFESFKAQVATVGEEAARLHGWCGAYDAILNELGLSPPRPPGHRHGHADTRVHRHPRRCRAGDVPRVCSGQPPA